MIKEFVMTIDMINNTMTKELISVVLVGQDFCHLSSLCISLQVVY